MSAPLHNHRTVEGVFQDYKGRHTAIVKALTTDVWTFYLLCNPDKKNLCLFGYPDEHWEVTIPTQEVPIELPQPASGINVCRDSMRERDWLAFVAAQSDAWLLSVAFHFGIRFNFHSTDRNRLFSMINELPTISETVARATRRQANPKPSVSNRLGFALGGNSRNAKDVDEDEDEDEDADDNSNAENEDEDADADEGSDEESEEEEEDGETLCGACGGTYATNEFWIRCDKCSKWFHGKCVKVTLAQADFIKQFKCPSCR